MLNIGAQIGVGVAAQVQIVIHIDRIAAVADVAGKVRIPVTHVGTETDNIGVSHRRCQSSGAAQGKDQFTHITPIRYCVVIVGQSN